MGTWNPFWPQKATACFISWDNTVISNLCTQRWRRDQELHCNKSRPASPTRRAIQASNKNSQAYVNVPISSWRTAKNLVSGKAHVQRSNKF